MPFVAEFAFYLLMEVIMYSIGRLVIPIISFGRARAVRAKELFGRNSMAYDEQSKMLVPEWGASLTGVLTLVALLSLYLALR